MLKNVSKEIVTEPTPVLRDEFEELLVDVLADLRPLHRVQRRDMSRPAQREGMGRSFARLAEAS